MKRAGTLKADFNGGCGEVEITDEFKRESPLFRADVLRDWITELQELYRDARADMHKEWMAAKGRQDGGGT